MLALTYGQFFIYFIFIFIIGFFLVEFWLGPYLVRRDAKAYKKKLMKESREEILMRREWNN